MEKTQLLSFFFFLGNRAWETKDIGKGGRKINEELAKTSSIKFEVCLVRCFL